MMTCPDCGELMDGDGYTLVLHCPNADDYDDREPDANPVYCGFTDEGNNVNTNSMGVTEAGKILGAAATIERALLAYDPEQFDVGCVSAMAVYSGIRDAQAICHGLAAHSGWWTDLNTGERLTSQQVNIAEKLCLVHSEVSEALEGARKNLRDYHLPDRPMLEVELADAIIRILDLAGFLDLDIAGAVIEKLAYNQMRADHKLENRKAAGGKAF